MPTQLGNATQVNTYTTGEQRNPTLALLQNGNIVVVWESQLQDGSGYGIYAQIMDASNNKVGTEFQVHTTTALDQVFPSVLALQNGNFVVFWQTKTAASTQYGYDINGQIFTQNATKVGPEFKVNNSTEVDNRYVPPSSAPTMKIDTLSDGSFILMWKINGSPSIAAQKFDITAAKIGTEFKINTTTADTTVFPTTTLKTGKFISVYTKNDADLTGVFAQGFNNDGTLLLPEFQVNTFTLNNQYYPFIIPLQDGGFLAAWVSDSQIGINKSFYGQRYDATFSKVGTEFLLVNSVYTYFTTFPINIIPLYKKDKIIFIYTTPNSYEAITIDIVNFEISKKILLSSNSYTTLVKNIIQLPNKNFFRIYKDVDASGYGIYGQLYDGQLTLNNFNKTLNYTEDTTTKISNISILGAFNENQINVTLSLSNPAAGNFSFPAWTDISTNYDQQNGQLSVGGSMSRINLFFNYLNFVPTQNSGQNLTMSFNITDNFSDPVSGQFNLTAIPVNDAPKIVNNQMTITQGNTIVLTQDNLSATDIDNPVGTLIFNVTSLQGGRFELIDFPGTAITNFTQQQVIDKKVQFVQDGTKSVSYYVSVSDGMLTTNPARATVNFVVVNPTPIATSTLTTTTALSSTSGSTPVPRTPTPVTTTLSSGFFQPQPSSLTTASSPSSSSPSSENINISPGGMAGVILGTIAGTALAVCGIFGIKSLNRVRKPLDDDKSVTHTDNSITTSVHGTLNQANNSSTSTGSSSPAYTNLPSDSTNTL